MDRYRGDVIHSSEYRNGDPWRGRPVLVVGFGNSACEQALDLVERGAEVHLAVRSAVNVLPRDIFGVVPVLPGNSYGSFETYWDFGPVFALAFAQARGRKRRKATRN